MKNIIKQRMNRNEGVLSNRSVCLNVRRTQNIMYSEKTGVMDVYALCDMYSEYELNNLNDFGGHTDIIGRSLG